MSLSRSLGLPMLTFYGVGMILGAGIYSIIGQAAGKAGNSLWLGFAFAAIAALFTALSYAELATMYPQAGGEYVYLRRAFAGHRWAAATTGILMSFAGCATAATVALAFSSYLQDFVHLPQFAVAAGLLILFTAVNIAGIQESSWLNAIFTLIEAGGLVLFIGLGWQNPKFGEAFFTAPTFATVSSAALIIFAYFGFENIVNLSEETREPEKNIPRAILLSLGISTILYILVSLAAVALLDPHALAQTETALTTAARQSSPRIAGVLGGIALFSTANTALIALVTTSRILYGISKDKSLPTLFTRTLTRRKTPWVAALAVLVIASILLPLKNVETVASVSSLATMLAFIAVNMALIALRFSHPHTHRPFRVPLTLGRWPLLPLLGIACAGIFLGQFHRQVYLIGIVALIGSWGVYFLNAKFGR